MTTAPAIQIQPSTLFMMSTEPPKLRCDNTAIAMRPPSAAQAV